MIYQLLLITTISVGLSSTTAATELQSNGQSRLLNDLFSNYDGRVRPVKSDIDPVQGTLGLSLTDVIETSPGIFSFEGWLAQKWKDEFLTWDPNNYGGLKKAFVYPRQPGQKEGIWVPDFTIYHGQIKTTDVTPTLAMVASDGNALWIPPRIFKVPCESVSDDLQRNVTCSLIFGSWVYSIKEFDVQLAGNVAEMWSSKKWRITGTSAEKKEITIPTLPDDVYRYFTYTVNLSTTARQN